MWLHVAEQSYGRGEPRGGQWHWRPDRHLQQQQNWRQNGYLKFKKYIFSALKVFLITEANGSKFNR